MAKQHIYIGFTDEQVLSSRNRYGANVLTPVDKEPWWKKLLEKFQDPLIVILLIAGVLSVGISFYEYYGLHKGSMLFYEPIGIFVAIILATGLAFIFEYKAEKEFSILNKVNDDEPVQVIRDGKVQHVPRRDVVVDDIVMLNTGEEVPADATLLEAHSLLLDESTLTGEPQCSKTADESQLDPQATYPSNQVLKGTKVMEGHGVAQVTAVGDSTENGKVMESAQIDSSVKTPLNEQLDKLGLFISKMSYLIGLLVIVGRIVAYFIYNPDAALNIDFVTYLLQTIMMAVTLVVVAVPEGLMMGLYVKNEFLIVFCVVNQTDRHFSVWMVVRLVGTDCRMPILLNSPTMRMAVFLLQFHNSESSPLEAMNWPGCRTAEKPFPDTSVSSLTAILRKVWKHITRLMPWWSSDRYSYCVSLSMTLYLILV